MTVLPVLGLRPVRSPLRLVIKLPKPDSFTMPSVISPSSILEIKEFTRCADSGFDTPMSRWIVAARSARVIVLCLTFSNAPTPISVYAYPELIILTIRTFWERLNCP